MGILQNIKANAARASHSKTLLAEYEALWWSMSNADSLMGGLTKESVSEHQAKAIEHSKPFEVFGELRAGTSWVNGQSPENDIQRVIHGQLDGLRGWFVENLVTNEDVQRFWDKSALEHGLIWESCWVLDQRLTYYFLRRDTMRGVFHVPIDRGLALAEIEIRRLAPSFLFIGQIPKDISDPDGRFPLEHFERVMPRFMAMVKDSGIEGLEDAISGHSSMSAFLRTEMLEGRL